MSHIDVSKIAVRETTNPYDFPNALFGCNLGKDRMGELLLAIHAVETMNICKDYNLELVYFVPTTDKEEQKEISKKYGFGSYIWSKPEVHLCIKRELSKYNTDVNNSQNRVHDYLEGIRDAIYAVLGKDADKPPRQPIVIKFDGEEYRVPGKNPKREEEVYYTTDKIDALQTAAYIHGITDKKVADKVIKI